MIHQQISYIKGIAGSFLPAEKKAHQMNGGYKI